jgi:GTP-binding protein YchF
VNTEINPLNDLEIIKTEILLADIDTIQKKLEKGKKKLLSSKEIDILEKKLNLLNKGSDNKLDLDEEKFLSSLGLLSIKPKIIVCNLDEGSLSIGNKYTEMIKKEYSQEKIVNICADIEDQIMGLAKDERESFMKEIGLNKTGLNKLIKEGYDLLILDTFFTSGPEESRAWTIEKNTFAPKAASVIHTDFEKNFIRAEVVTCEDFIKYGSAEKCKEVGKLRIEGKDYIVKDGDVLYFRVNP